jgi:NAD(P)H-hydrate repair Nnr-like enzyme with NAD(P)H-hydrate dehydratase domain
MKLGSRIILTPNKVEFERLKKYILPDKEDEKEEEKT